MIQIELNKSVLFAFALLFVFSLGEDNIIMQLSNSTHSSHIPIKGLQSTVIPSIKILQEKDERNLGLEDDTREPPQSPWFSVSSSVTPETNSSHSIPSHPPTPEESTINKTSNQFKVQPEHKLIMNKAYVEIQKQTSKQLKIEAVEKFIQKFSELTKEYISQENFEFPDYLSQFKFPGILGSLKDYKGIISLYNLFFSSKEEEECLAFKILFNAVQQPDKYKESAWVLLLLSKNLEKVYEKIKSPLQSEPRSRSGSQDSSSSEEDNNNISPKSKLNEKEVELSFEIIHPITQKVTEFIERLYKFDTIPNTLKDYSDNDLLENIDKTERELKAIYKKIKNVTNTNREKLYEFTPSGIGMWAMYNLSTDLGSLLINIGNSVARIFTYLAAYAVGGLCYAGWRAFARVATPEDKQRAEMLTHLLIKQVNTYQSRENVRPFSLEFLNKVNKYQKKMRNKITISLKTGTRQSSQIHNNEARSPLLAEEVPSTIPPSIVQPPLRLNYDFRNLLKTLIKQLAVDQDFEGFESKLINLKNEYGGKFKDFIETSFKYKKSPSTLAMHLLNIYNNKKNKMNANKYTKSKELKEKQIQDLKGIILFLLRPQVQQAENLLNEEDWKNRTKAFALVHDILDDVMKDNSLSPKDKQHKLECMIEDLKEGQDPFQGEIDQRTKKGKIEAGAAALLLQSYNIKLGFPAEPNDENPDAAYPFDSSMKNIAATAAGWVFAGALLPVLMYLSTTNTPTFKSILATFEGTIKMLEPEAVDAPLSSALHPSDSISENIRAIHVFLGNNKKLSDESADFIISRLKACHENITERSAGDIKRLNQVLEYKHGRALYLIDELMEKMPSGKYVEVLKLYFQKEDIGIQTYAYNSFNKLLHKLDKHSKKSTSLSIRKAFAYLLEFDAEIKTQELNGNLEVAQMKKIYDACKNKLTSTLENIENNKLSSFRKLIEVSEKQKVFNSLKTRTVGNILFGLVSTTVALSILKGSFIIAAFGIGSFLTATGIGLAIGIGIIAICAAYRIFSNVYSENSTLNYDKKTESYENLLKFSNKLPSYSDTKSNLHFNKVAKDLNETLFSAIKENDAVNLKAQIKEKLGLLSGDNESYQSCIDSINRASNYAEKLNVFENIKKELLEQHIDKESLLESFYHIVHIITQSNFDAIQKIDLFAELFEELENKGSLLAKLKMENDFGREKNWFIPQIFFGSFAAVGLIVSTLIAAGTFPISILGLAIFAKISTATIGDVISGLHNRSIFNAPMGRTKSYQMAAELLQIMMLQLMIENHEGLSPEQQDNFGRILNTNISRWRIPCKQTSIFGTEQFKIYQKLSFKTELNHKIPNPSFSASSSNLFLASTLANG